MLQRTISPVDMPKRARRPGFQAGVVRTSVVDRRYLRSHNGVRKGWDLAQPTVFHGKAVCNPPGERTSLYGARVMPKVKDPDQFWHVRGIDPNADRPKVTRQRTRTLPFVGEIRLGAKFTGFGVPTAYLGAPAKQWQTV